MVYGYNVQDQNWFTGLINFFQGKKKGALGAQKHMNRFYICVLLMKAILVPSGDQLGTLMVPCPP